MYSHIFSLSYFTVWKFPSCKRSRNSPSDKHNTKFATCSKSTCLMFERWLTSMDLSILVVLLSMGIQPGAARAMLSHAAHKIWRQASNLHGFLGDFWIPAIIWGSQVAVTVSHPVNRVAFLPSNANIGQTWAEMMSWVSEGKGKNLGPGLMQNSLCGKIMFWNTVNEMMIFIYIYICKIDIPTSSHIFPQISMKMRRLLKHKLRW